MFSYYRYFSRVCNVVAISFLVINIIDFEEINFGGYYMLLNETIVQLLTALGNIGSIIGGVQAAATLLTDKQKVTLITEFESVVNLGVIDETLLGNISNRAKEASDRLSDAYKNRANNPQDLNREKVIAREEVCRYLKDVKEFNEDVLPLDYLKKLWRSFGCENM